LKKLNACERSLTHSVHKTKELGLYIERLKNNGDKVDTFTFKTIGEEKSQLEIFDELVKKK